MLVANLYLFNFIIVHFFVLFLESGEIWIEGGDELLVIGFIGCTDGNFSDLIDAVCDEFEEISRWKYAFVLFSCMGIEAGRAQRVFEHCICFSWWLAY